VKRTALLALLLLATIGVGSADARSYSAEIARTSGGIPHIKASSWADIGYGYGFAYAQDNLCTLADTIVTVSAERSKYFGPDSVWGDSGQFNNLKSDYFFQRVNDLKIPDKLFARKPPNGPLPDVKRTIVGFVAGYNAYLGQTGVSKLPDPRCRGAKWVRPITVRDMYRRFFQLTVRASSANFLAGFVDAAPPATALPQKTLAPGELQRRLATDPVLGVDSTAMGSNAYGIGSKLSANGDGIVLGNPHFPWAGHERFYESHLTIPGKVDVIGASLQGVPFINIGFTHGVAWSHTVSTARRFTPYELTLVQGDPMSYMLDGKPVKMATRTVTVPLPDGQTSSHVFFESRWGPVFVSSSNGFFWTDKNAYAMADVNADNARIGNTWFLMDQAQTVRELKKAQDQTQGIPWVFTVAADSKGEAYFADNSVVPNVDKAKVDQCVTSDFGKAVLAAGNLPVLDGSRSSCAWGTDKDAIQPGTFGPKKTPFVFRKDYVENSNDSHWVTNPRQRLEGFPQIWGPERTTRSLRMRLGMKMLEERIAAGKKVSAGDVRALLYNDRNLSAEMGRDAVVNECRAHPQQSLPDGRSVNIAEACDVLAAWDTHAFLTSRGEILWREFFDRFTTAVPAADRFTVAFDPADPVGTPNTFNTGNPALLQSLADAVDDMRVAGVPLNASVAERQAEPKGKELVPIHGCRSVEGCFDVIEPFKLGEADYRDIRTGSSFVMVVEMGRNGPQGQSILTYSQSENPKSKYFADQTRLFSQRRWLPMLFSDRAIRADKAYSRTIVGGSG
jgi:acyl-homoserine-lactone acylase